MECREAIEYINLYVDNMLSDAENEQLLAHIRSCESCKKYLEDITAIKNAVSKLEKLEPPVGLALSAVKKAKRRKIPVFAYASAGIAAVIALVVIFSPGALNKSNDLAQENVEYSALYGESADAEMEGFAAPMATPAPEEPEAPEMKEQMTLGAACDERGAGSQEDDALPYSILVAPEYTESIRQLVVSYIEKYDVEFEITDTTITFIIPKQYLEEIQSIIAEANIDFEEKLIGGYRIEFVFIDK